MNLGRSAGAGVAGHLHLHIVPRWAGDSNFMATTGDVRVISFSLEDVYRALHKYFRRP
jgi:ATP adenylyltransferase